MQLKKQIEGSSFGKVIIYLFIYLLYLVLYILNFFLSLGKTS